VYKELDAEKEAPTASFATQSKVDSTAEKKALREHQTPVEIRGNRVLVPVEVAMGNRVAQLSLLLDTGATTTVLHRESLAGLDLPSGKSFKARVAGGGTVKSEKIRFRHIDIGPFREEKVYAMVINLQGQELSFDGMLGMDFLKAHPYQIDFQNQLINWEPVD
jgi:predicted aspartyl protease